jgi:hypothetical protein
MVHRMFRIFYLPIIAAKIANNRQQAGTDAVAIPSEDVLLPFFIPPKDPYWDILPNLERCLGLKL